VGIYNDLCRFFRLCHVTQMVTV